MKKHFKKLVLVLAVTLAGAMASAWDWTSYCGNLDGKNWLLKAGVGFGYATATVKYKDVKDEYARWVGKEKVYGSGFVIPIQGEYLLSAIPLGITAQVRPMFGSNGDWKETAFSIIVGANYHVAPGPDWLDLYAGLGLGVNLLSVKYDWGYGSYHETFKGFGAGFAFDAHVGATFMFTNTMGVSAEFGYPNYATVSFSLAL